MFLKVESKRESTESDFDEYFRSKNSDKKSMDCRVIQRVLELEILGVISPSILSDRDNMAFARELTSSQLLEFSSLLKTNWAVTITPDFDLISEVAGSVDLTQEIAISGDSLSFHYFTELLFNCAGNYRQIYNEMADSLVRTPLVALSSLSPSELYVMCRKLDEQNFIGINVDAQGLQNTVEEVKKILSQDLQVYKAVHQGASKQFLEYFFPNYSYLDSRSVTILRSFFGGIKNEKNLNTKEKNAFVEKFTGMKEVLDKDYSASRITFSEYQSRLFNSYFHYSFENNISLKKLWKIEKDFSRKTA